MFLKIIIVMLAVVCSECAYIYSSFWAPLFNPRILNYKVDMKFDPNAGKNERQEFERNYGYRAENLIADIGNGKGPTKVDKQNQNYGDVKVYYTYPGAQNYENHGYTNK